MKEHSEEDPEYLRARIMGFGDMSLRKSYYPQLQQRMQELLRFRNLLDRVSESIIVYSLSEQSIIDINQAACLLLDITPELIKGEVLPADDSEKERLHATREIIDRCLNCKPKEMVRLESKGREIFLEITCSHIDMGSGKYLVLIARDRSEQKRWEERLTQSLTEKDVLLKEVHHRVKNNLQILSSLISLQAEGMQDSAIREQFKKYWSRIRSMALIHEKLYATGDLANIDFKVYLESLVAFLQGIYDTSGITFSIQGSHLNLDVNTAVPGGLIINELITNSIRHAFPEGVDGIISINISEEEDRSTISVCDNGRGLPEGYDPSSASTLGFQLVYGLVDQIDGKMKVLECPGACFSLSFPIT